MPGPDWESHSRLLIKGLDDANKDLKSLRDRVSKLEIRVAVGAGTITIIINLIAYMITRYAGQ